MTSRIVSSLVFFLFFFLGLFHEWFRWMLPMLVLLGCGMGLWEFLRFGRESPPLLFIFLAFASALALLADAYWFHLQHAMLIIGLQTVLTLGIGTLRLEKDYAERGGKCLIGTLYVTLPLALITEIVRSATAFDRNNGQHYLIFLVLCTQMADTGAFFVGRMIGKHKLAPRLSPGKTWEGFIGGMACTLLLAIIFKLTWNNMSAIFSWPQLIFLALMISIIGPIGDLTESWFKRTSEMKDSGKTLTGHGGMLDIIDSLLFTTIFYYAYLWIEVPDLVRWR